MMMQFVMSNVVMMRESSAEDEEQRMLQRVIEESKRDSGVNDQPNPDDMTYEQLLELEENNGGRVSKGLKPQ
jgi:hypothetical protein